MGSFLGHFQPEAENGVIFGVIFWPIFGPRQTRAKQGPIPKMAKNDPCKPENDPIFGVIFNTHFGNGPKNGLIYRRDGVKNGKKPQNLHFWGHFLSPFLGHFWPFLPKNSTTEAGGLKNPKKAPKNGPKSDRCGGVAAKKWDRSEVRVIFGVCSSKPRLTVRLPPQKASRRCLQKDYHPPKKV